MDRYAEAMDPVEVRDEVVGQRPSSDAEELVVEELPAFGLALLQGCGDYSDY